MKKIRQAQILLSKILFPIDNFAYLLSKSLIIYNL